MIEIIKKFTPRIIRKNIKSIVYKIKLARIHNKTLKKKKNTPNDRVIYTCVTGDYDNIILHKFRNLNWDYICFTDNKKLLAKKEVNGWITKPLAFNKLDNQRNSRWHKFFPNNLFPKYKYSIWIDASLNVLDSFLFDRTEELIKTNKIISQPIHSTRDCIYDEAKEVIRAKLDHPHVVLKQIELIKKDKYPAHNGLNENTFIFRKHNDKKCKKIMNDWWKWLTKYSRRDQLSFNYVVWKNKFRSEPFSEDNKILRQSNHFLCMPGKRKNREIKNK